MPQAHLPRLATVVVTESSRDAQRLLQRAEVGKALNLGTIGGNFLYLTLAALAATAAWAFVPAAIGLPTVLRLDVV